MQKELLQSSLQQMLDVAKAIAEGDYSKEAVLENEGLIGELAGEINNTVRNLRSAVPTFSQTSGLAPTLAGTAQSVGDLMNESTKVVLDSSEKIIASCETIDPRALDKPTLNKILRIKEMTLDIISAQSYQDKARQKLEKMEGELSHMKDALIEAMLTMNVKPKEVPDTNRQEEVMEVESTFYEDQKQDLVDQLLAEFGL